MSQPVVNKVYYLLIRIDRALFILFIKALLLDIKIQVKLHVLN